MEINGIRDIRMVSRALTQRWPISDDDKAASIKRLVEVVGDPKSSERAVLAAAKGLLAAEEQNQKDDHRREPAPQPEPNRFLEIAKRLGIVDESMARISVPTPLTNGSGRSAESGE